MLEYNMLKEVRDELKEIRLLLKSILESKTTQQKAVADNKPKRSVNHVGRNTQRKNNN